MKKRKATTIIEPEMVYVPAAKFMMDDDSSARVPLGQLDLRLAGLTVSDDGAVEFIPPPPKPRLEIYLDAFYVAKYPITNQEYNEFLKDTGRKKPRYRNDVIFNGPRQPAVWVNWNDAVAYCEWLSMKTGKKYRLPTDAEWEMAARGTDDRRYPWGNEEPDRTFANYNMHVGHTTKVDEYPKNKSPYGVMDMAGNVGEWCSDWWDGDFSEIKRCLSGGGSSIRNPKGPANGTARVARGGSWFAPPDFIRTSFRLGKAPGFEGYSSGFRCAMTPCLNQHPNECIMRVLKEKRAKPNIKLGMKQKLGERLRKKKKIKSTRKK
jgi:formylglycine-generating enzyme required for sulfatase activity